MGKRSARPSRTTSRCALRLGNRDGKRMPEYDPLHIARSTLQEKCERLRAIGRIERETVLGCEPFGRLPFRGRMAVALPQPVHDVEGAGSGERYSTVRERSEERRVGKECRAGGGADHCKEDMARLVEGAIGVRRSDGRLC